MFCFYWKNSLTVFGRNNIHISYALNLWYNLSTNPTPKISYEISMYDHWYPSSPYITLHLRNIQTGLAGVLVKASDYYMLKTLKKGKLVEKQKNNSKWRFKFRITKKPKRNIPCGITNKEMSDQREQDYSPYKLKIFLLTRHNIVTAVVFSIYYSWSARRSNCGQKQLPEFK